MRHVVFAVGGDNLYGDIRLYGLAGFSDENCQQACAVARYSGNFLRSVEALGKIRQHNRQSFGDAGAVVAVFDNEGADGRYVGSGGESAHRSASKGGCGVKDKLIELKAKEAAA